MSKLDKEWKSEVNREFKEADYVGRKIALRIFIVVVAIGILSAIGGVAYKKWKVGKDREIFKESITYTESAASFLADSYAQYNATEDDTEKKTIREYVRMRYPNLDETEIENEKLRLFYNKCIMGD